MLSLPIVLPFLSIMALNLPFAKSFPKVAFWWALLLFTGQVLVATLLPFTPLFKSFGVPVKFLQFDLKLDSLSILMLLCIGLVSAISLGVGMHLVKEGKRQFNFINLLLFAFAGMNGVVLVNDIFSLYIFVEITAVASYILISFDKDLKALSAAFKYIILSIVATVLMLASIALLLVICGDTNFSVINAVLADSKYGFLILSSIGVFMCGLFIKAGVIPFHAWLPDAYTHAPAHTSVLLAGIISKTLGIYTLIRVVAIVFIPNFSINAVLLAIGALSIILGALSALAQNDFKRMLSYSSISQVGYIVLGVGAGNPLGLAAAGFHLLNHAVFKSLLFINSASLEEHLGTRDMLKMGGLGKFMPIASTTSVLGSLSCAGIPPLAGFWSKLLIVIALWLSGHYIYASIAILGSILTLAYFLWMQRLVFFGKTSEHFANIKETGFALAFTQILLAAATVGIGLFFPFILNKFILPLMHIAKV